MISIKMIYKYPKLVSFKKIDLDSSLIIYI